MILLRWKEFASHSNDSAVTIRPRNSRETKSNQHKNLYITVIAKLLIVAEGGNNPNAYQWINKGARCGMKILWSAL